MSPSLVPVLLPSQIRRLRAEGDDDQAEAIESVIADQAEEMEAKGSAVAGHWYRTALYQGKPLDELLETWLTGSGLKLQTQETYRRAFRDLRTMLGAQPEHILAHEDITDDVAVQFATEYLPAQGLSQKSMVTRLGALSSFWQWLQSRRIVPLHRNPWRGHRVTKKAVQEGPRSRRSPQKERAYSDAELVSLLTGTDRSRGWSVYPVVRDLLLIGLYTGARLNEVCSLLVKDVTIENDCALITIREGKTEAATRGLAIVHFAVLGVLQRRIAGKQAEDQIFHELKPGGPDGKLSWQASKSFTRYRRACGVPDGCDYHGLRRTFLTLHEHRGTDYIAVARFVGHQVPTMMHAVYSAGASREALYRVAEATRYAPVVEQAVAHLVAV